MGCTNGMSKMQERFFYICSLCISQRSKRGPCKLYMAKRLRQHSQTKTHIQNNVDNDTTHIDDMHDRDHTLHTDCIPDICEENISMNDIGIDFKYFDRVSSQNFLNMK